MCHPSWHWLIVAKLTVSGTQLSNQNNAFLSTGDNLWIGSSLGRRQVCHLMQKQAAQHLASSVPELWKNTTSCQLLFWRPKGKILAEVAPPLPDRRESFAFVDALSRSSRLWVAGFPHCPTYTANLGIESAREAFLCIHFSHPVICSDLRETVHGICQSSRNNVSGGLLLELLSNSRWQQSIRIALVSVKEKKTRASLPLYLCYFWWCWIILSELILLSQATPV